MRALKAFLLGIAAGAVFAYTAAATAALVVSAASGELQLAIGPVELLVVERTEVGTETTFGAGLIGVALVAGIANAAAASVLALRAR